MDLIFMGADKNDIGVVRNYSLDLAFGANENDFQVETTPGLNGIAPKNYIYIEGTEYGGVVDRIKVETAHNKLYYVGRTWHGILASKVLEPDPGNDYLAVSGELNAVLRNLIARMGLTGLFAADTGNSGVSVSYQFHRYANGYAGLTGMLKSIGRRLKVRYHTPFVMLYTEEIIDYSEDEEFDNGQLDFRISKNYAPVNHLICLGRGDLAARQVIHLYVNANGGIVSQKYYTGMDEVVDILDYPNAESLEELRMAGIEKLAELNAADELSLNINATRHYEVGDIIAARELNTGITVKTEISKKIVTIKDGIVKIKYEVGE